MINIAKKYKRGEGVVSAPKGAQNFMDENSETNIVVSFYWLNKILPACYFPLDGTIMQVYAHLLSIWNRSFKKIWPFERRMAHAQENLKMPSMGRSWS